MTSSQPGSYSIDLHRLRFAAWAAGRAASVKGCRFSVEQARTILEQAGVAELLIGPDRLPESPKLDAAHRTWRASVIAHAKTAGLDLTHGVAAKLINVYLKAGLVCGGHHLDPRVQALHPPIDSLLLEELHKHDVGGLRAEWAVARGARWSKLSSDQYEATIAAVRKALGPATPLWRIEEHWRGFQ